MHRYALRDDQWERIESLVPGKAGDRGRTARDNRLFVEAVLYRGTSKNALWRQNRGIGRHAALGLSVSVALERLV